MPVTGHPRHLQVRHDTAANWTAENPVLREGEQGYETDTGRLKFGDGVTAWNALAYFGGSGSTTAAGGSSMLSIGDESGLDVPELWIPPSGAGKRGVQMKAANYTRSRNTGFLDGVYQWDVGAFTEVNTFADASEYHVIKWNGTNNIRAVDPASWLQTAGVVSGYWSGTIPAGCWFWLPAGIYAWNFIIQFDTGTLNPDVYATIYVDGTESLSAAAAVYVDGQYDYVFDSGSGRAETGYGGGYLMLPKPFGIVPAILTSGGALSPIEYASFNIVQVEESA